MKTETPIRFVAVLLLLAGLCRTFSAVPLGTAFTYQGKLSSGTNAANGSFDLKFSLYDALTSGNQISSSVTNTATVLTNGYFTVVFDFGGVFGSDARWLEIGVRTNGTGTFTTLSPRQDLTASPFALYAMSAGTALTASGLYSGTYSNALTLNNAADTFAGNGAGLTSLNASQLTSGTVPAAALSNAWKTAGNSGTTAGTQFLGTADYQPLELKVNGTRAFRLEPTINDASHSNIVNEVGGSPANSITLGTYGSVIAGGGAASYNGFSLASSVAADLAFLGGGGGNSIQPSGAFSFLGGGYANSIQTNAQYSVLGGGFHNIIQPNAGYASLGGGYYNTNGGAYAVVAGGYQNLASGQYSVVAGGNQNGASGNAATVGGGLENTAGLAGTVAGGQQNNAGGAGAAVGGGVGNGANANYAVVAGGLYNLATGPGAFIGGGGNDGSSIGGNVASGAASVIGGGLRNAASGMYAAIGGGSNNIAGAGAFVGGGLINAATYPYATVTGGYSNQAAAAGAFVGGGGTDGSFAGGNTASGQASTIAGGFQNSTAYGYSTVGGGRGNVASNYLATVAGGFGNQATGAGAFVGGGGFDSLNYSGNLASGPASAVGGGYANGATASYATVPGGYQNLASGEASAVGGGFANWATAFYATVPGGSLNLASGSYSFAAGQHAKAQHTGAFVWADSQAADFSSSANDQFNIRAAGGVYIQSGMGISLNAANSPLITRAWDPFTSGAYTGLGRWGLFMEPYYLTLGFPSVSGRGFQIARYDTNSFPTWLVRVDLYGNLYTVGAVNPPSDRAVKRDFAAVDPQAVLEGVARLPLQTWAYTNSPSVRHLGPVAQDFHAAFGLGEDDKHIATVDADGVALAAIQGLNQKVEEQRAELKQKQTEITDLKGELSELKNLVNSLTQKLNEGAK